MRYDILLAGVGGQGLMLLSAVLGEACVASTLNVVTSEQHGLAQRSGSITAHVRMGEVYSPLIPYGAADMIISMEVMEALRNIEYLKHGGKVITSNRLLHPIIETSFIVNRRNENPTYVTIEQVTAQLRKATDRLRTIDAQTLAKIAGNPRTENTVLLGAASADEEFPITRDVIIEAIKRTVPEKSINVNLEAFELGYKVKRTRSQK